MKIAVDNRALASGHSVRGVGFYTKNLIEALGAKVKGVNFEEIDLGKFDLIHYPFFDLFSHTLPIIKPTKTVVTIHDLIPLVYPEHYPAGIKGKMIMALQKFSVRNADAIITDSETSKKDICRFLDIPSDKITVVRLAPGRMFKRLGEKEKQSAREKYRLPVQFVLYVGDINYNKNIPILVKACEIAKVRLVIVGKEAKKVESLNLNHPELRHLKEVDFSNTLRLGFIPEKDLVAVINCASVYAQASLYEGFGLPILQAFACGLPVVSSKTQALVEIGEGSCLFSNPNNPDDFAKNIKKLMSEIKLREKLVSNGYRTVGKFSWEKTANETFAVYKKI